VDTEWTGFIENELTNKTNKVGNGTEMAIVPIHLRQKDNLLKWLAGEPFDDIRLLTRQQKVV